MSRPVSDPPHPSARQRARSPSDLPDLVLCTGPAEHYRDNIHAELKLVLIPAGAFEVRRRGTTHRAGPRQLIALHGNDTHSGGPLDVEPGWALLCLPPSRLDEHLCDSLIFHDPVLPSPDLASSFLHLLQLLESPANTLHKETATLRFVDLLRRHCDRPSGEVGSVKGSKHRMHAARDFLGDQLDRKVTLDELAEVAGLSKYHIAREFTREFGLPPHTLHLRLRLNHAQTLLRRGEPPAEVAQATGFADQAHLSNRFQQIYGLTPRQHYANSRRRP